MSCFSRFAAIDWSGAKGSRHKGIAIASCEAGDAAPLLVRPGFIWSRGEVLEWLLEAADEAPTLFGFDLSAGLAFADRGAYFPGWERSPGDARALWDLVESLCGEETDLGASGFADLEEASRHFRRVGGRCGNLFEAGAGRMRLVERESRRQGLCNPVSNFNLVGAAQVGKASLTGMRLLRRLSGKVPLWPFDPLPVSGSLVVEIYTSIAAAVAGLPRGRTKIRDAATLDRALEALDSRPHAPLAHYDDHATDALLATAWLRSAADQPRLWAPEAMNENIARTEGWTFGVP